MDNCNLKKNFVIKLANSEDVEELRFLIQELADFEKMSNKPKISSQQLALDLSRNAVQSFVIYDLDNNKSKKKMVAMTLFYYAYSTWQGQYIHMEDLYVCQKYRRQGLANVLVKRIAKLAVEKKIKRVNWSVLDWNKGAREFYKNLGAINLSETEGWLIYRLEEDQLKKFAN